MHKTTVYLDDETQRRLRRLADASGRTQADIIRDAILAYSGGSKRRRPRSIGIGRGGRDLSARVDSLLEGFGEKR
ncbi:MAG: ribbon-helix-helix protein, CopG family [Deltaproteobacteria bacterium]|nr:ribbon-helix-helix protein, CopG family [Deltaproteobacteria bacterium]